MVGTSHVFPPGYRNGEIWRTDATFTIRASNCGSFWETRVAMALLQIGEVFGHDTALSATRSMQNLHPCPFRGNECTKGNKADPLGICSFTDGTFATVVCPVRFLEGGTMFRDAATIAFGKGASCVAVPEVRVLEVFRNGKRKKIGKVDFLIVHIEEGKAVDFAALEVQAVYISGASVRPAFDHYVGTGELSGDGKRRPDFRSSAQKRLMPQLALKVPIFRRWGKRFFVVTDRSFFSELPTMSPQSSGNSEVTWLAYDFERQAEGGYRMHSPKIIHTLWVDVEAALREGKAPEKSELLSQLTESARKLQLFIT
jgi:Restriction endonuclease NotI